MAVLRSIHEGFGILYFDTIPRLLGFQASWLPGSWLPGFLAGWLRLAVTGVGRGGAPLPGSSAGLPDHKLGEIQGTRSTP